MNSEPSVPTCPQCGAAIPADAPQGLCPRCVLLGAATTTDSGKPLPRTEPPTRDALRAAFPQLEIVELIGRGGMGFVYKARHAKLDRLVALKLLPLELGADPHFAERFHREARALARLNHPSIVSVYDFGVSAGFGYLLMEFVDGVNLRQAMQAGRFTQREALAIVPKICEAIQFAHEQGVLHRDIKPENILLDSQGRVKIADFGIAKLVGDDAPDLRLTQQGARLGTPTYMAPEQIEHPETVDHRADIYSLGVVFYELLTGELPLGLFAPPSAKGDLDARVDAIVMRALAKERELRQQSAGEVKTEVETVTASPRPPAAAPPLATAISTALWSPRKWVGSWLLVVAVVLGVLLVFVAGKTVSDLGLGRSRVQPVELVVFLVVTGAALLCWRLGRKLHGRSAPGVPAENLPDRPFLFADVAPAWKPWLLVGLGLSGTLFCFQAVTMLLPMVGAAAAVVRSGPLPFVLLLLAGCALIAGAWHGTLRRRELMQSLSLHVPESGPVMDRWLGRAAVLMLAGLGGGMLIGLGCVLLVVAGQLNGHPGSNGLLLVAVVVIIGLAATWNRRASGPPEPIPEPGPAPAWMRRAGWWFLAVGGIALLPTLVHWNASVSVWHSASLLVFTGVALMSASRGLRRLALLVNWFELFSGLGGCLALLWFGSRHELPEGISVGMPDLTARPGPALLFAALQTAGFVAGLMALHRADARAAFGVTRPPGAPRVLGIVTLAGVGVTVLLFSFIQWKTPRATPAEWTASPVSMAGAPERTGATLHFTEASTAGSVLLLNIYSEAGFQQHLLTPQFAGAAAKTGQAVLPERLQTDCLLEPRRGDNAASDFGGRVLAGQRDLAGPGTLRIGFIFPTTELAELARDQVQKDWVGRSRILEQPQVIVLFQLQRSKLIHPHTREPMEEGFVGSLAFNVLGLPVAAQPEAVVGPVDTKADILVQLARERLENLRRRSGVGAVPPLEVAAAERDLAVAEARGNEVAVAQANRTYASLALESARKQYENGKLTSLEFRGYEATNRIAEIELAAALHPTGKTAPADGTNQIGSTFQARLAAIRLDLAKQNLAELRKQAEVGAVAPQGKEILAAELTVTVAEADLKGDALTAAKARLSHAEKVLDITEKMLGVGKATSIEVAGAKLAVGEAAAGVAKLERRP